MIRVIALGLLLFSLPCLAADRLAGQMRSLPMPPIERVDHDADGKLRMSAAFRFCLDAEARIRCLEPLPDQNPALVNSLLDLIPNWKFRSAARDGQRAAAESTLWVHLVGQPSDDGQYTLKVAHVDTGPRSIKRPMPRYPQASYAEIEAAM